jgi:hypothetical protein
MKNVHFSMKSANRLVSGQSLTRMGHLHCLSDLGTMSLQVTKPQG